MRAGDAALLFLSAASGATDVIAFVLLGHVAATWLHSHRAARSLRPLFLVEMVLVAAFALAWRSRPMAPRRSMRSSFFRRWPWESRG